MAGAGYKLFNTGDVLTAAQVNTYLQEQVVMVFASATARTTALSGVLSEGMMSYLQDTNAVEVYDGSTWVSVGSTGDITGITTGANSGLTGGVTSGTADLKLNFASKGQLAVGTGSGTTTFLNVGTNDYVLTAASGETSGLKWAAATAGKVVQIQTGTLTTTATTTSTSFVDTGLTVSITPSSASNYILIFASVPYSVAGSGNGGMLTLADGSDNNLINASSPGSRIPSFARFEPDTSVMQFAMIGESLVFKHSPATTSSFTYKVRHRVTGAGATSLINRVATDTDSAAFSRGVATITVMEVTP